MAAALDARSARQVDSSGDGLARHARTRCAGRPTVDCGLAGTVMRFVPPVAALADGPVHVRRRPARPDPADGRGPRARCAGSGSTSTTAAAAACRSPSAGPARSRGGQVVIDASASSQFVSALLLAGARYDEGVDVLHDGKPVPVAPPHRHDGRRAPRARRRASTTTSRTGGAVQPGPVRAVDVTIEPDLSNAAPFLAVGAVTGGPGHGRAAGRAATTQAGDRLREILDADGRRRSTSTTRGLTRHRRPARCRASTSTCTTSASSRRRSPRSPRSPTSPSVLRGVGAHPRPRDRPARARWRPSSPRLGGDVAERPDGLEIRPAAAARRGLPHLRRPPDGPRRRDPRARRPRRAGGGRRHHRQDLPRLPGRLVRARSGAEDRWPAGAATSTSSRSRSTGPAGAPGRAPRSARRYDDAVDAVVVTVDRGRLHLPARRRRGRRRHRDEVPAAGPQGRRRRRPGPAGRRRLGRRRRAGPDRRGRRAHDRAAPHRRRRRPRRAGRSSPTPTSS